VDWIWIELLDWTAGLDYWLTQTASEGITETLWQGFEVAGSMPATVSLGLTMWVKAPGSYIKAQLLAYRRRRRSQQSAALDTGNDWCGLARLEWCGDIIQVLTVVFWVKNSLSCLHEIPARYCSLVVRQVPLGSEVLPLKENPVLYCRYFIASWEARKL